MTKLIGGCHTNRGAYRDENEDAVFFRAIVADGKLPFAVGAVCDGIGGLDCGELSSGTVVDSIGRWFDAVSLWLDTGTLDSDVLFSHLKDGAEAWNEALYQMIRDKGIRSGTTMSCLMLAGGRYYIVHVGDSRIYRYRKKTGLQPLTTDASVTRVKDGRAKTFLDNYMGKQESLQFESARGDMLPGDLFLYCSDGFYHGFGEGDAAELYDKLMAGTAPDALCAYAVQTMISRGERDNVSLGILFLPPADEEKKSRFSLFGGSKK